MRRGQRTLQPERTTFVNRRIHANSNRTRKFSINPNTTVYERKVLYSPSRVNLRRAWPRKLRRLLCCQSRVWALLSPRAVLRRRLSCGSRWGSTLLSRSRILVRPHLLRLEAGTLGSAAWATSLDPRPLRRARILSQRLASIDPLDHRRRQAPARQTKTRSRRETA